MIIYIAGPMTGIPELNYPEFNRVAAVLRQKGYTVLNPAENPEQETWQGYMRLSIKQVADADEVWLLDGWENSKGARLEVQIAQALDIPVRNANDWIGFDPDALRSFRRSCDVMPLEEARRLQVVESDPGDEQERGG